MASRTMVMTDGGLPALLALGTARSGVLLLPVVDPDLAARQRHAIDRQAEVYGAEVVSPGEAGPPGRSTGIGASQVLMWASRQAVEAGCSALLWPVYAPAAEDLDLDGAATAADRALLVSRLVGLDAQEHAQPAFGVETPFIDLTESQIADLAVDVDIPVPLCWWWGGGSAPMDADESARWIPLLRRFGWTGAAVA